jgi:glycerol uptake facilitator protein
MPLAPATGAAIDPTRTVGPMLVQQLAGGSGTWTRRPVYLIPELLDRPAAIRAQTTEGPAAI